MDDYISREAAKTKKVYSRERHEYVVPVAEIDWLPAADVRPVVKGAWVPSERIKGYDVCSVCHDCYIDSDWKGMKWKFCPNCGADMRGNEKKEREG